MKNGNQNMEYKIKFSERCLEDIDDICDYISRELKSNNAANKLRNKIKECVIDLKTSPKMYAKINKIGEYKRIYRRIIINNYIILYTIDEKDKIIYISHMYYGGRNYLESLD